MGSLQSVNVDTNSVATENGTLSYDYFILALGTETNYFGMQNVKQASLPMKTIDEALMLRNILLLNMEKAVKVKDNAKRDRLLNIVIAGGGPTSVELAGMLAELGTNMLKKNILNCQTLVHTFTLLMQVIRCLPK